MGLFDSFSADNTSQFAKNVEDLSASSLGSGNNMDGAAYYKVYIVAATEHGDNINITADGPESFSFDTSVDYDTPYKNTGEDIIHAAANKMHLGGVADMATKAATASGTKLFTQALTAKVWSGAGMTRLSVPLIFQVEDDPEQDVLLPLMQLMYLSMPREEKVGGFLSGPGPRFDLSKAMDEAGSGVMQLLTGSSEKSDGFWKTAKKVAGNLVSTATSAVGAPIKTTIESANKTASILSNGIKNSVKNQISVQIGTSFRLESVVITSVSQVQRMSPIGYEPGVSSGINSSVKVDVTFESFYTLTQRDIRKMLLPMGYGGATDKMYQSLIGDKQNA